MQPLGPNDVEFEGVQFHEELYPDHEIGLRFTNLKLDISFATYVEDGKVDEPVYVYLAGCLDCGEVWTKVAPEFLSPATLAPEGKPLTPVYPDVP